MERIKWLCNRIICKLVGCKIKHEYGSAYMPDDYNAPDYCTRCHAVYDFYQRESTVFPLLYEEETPLGLVKMFFQGRVI